jgi:hypothetical protein
LNKKNYFSFLYKKKKNTLKASYTIATGIGTNTNLKIKTKDKK